MTLFLPHTMSYCLDPTVFWLRSIGSETISAALHGNGLTWKNSGLNTGAHVVPLGSRRADTTAIGSLGSVDGQEQQRQGGVAEAGPQG
jgi:hypothetical protein